MSRANKLPWFKLWAGKIRSDSNWRKLTTAQRGIFIDLMCADWVEGGVPENPEEAVHECARDAKVRDVAVVLRLFTVKIGEGRVSHKHQESARAECDEQAKAQSRRASKGWETKRAGKMPGDSSGSHPASEKDAKVMPGDAREMPKACPADADKEGEQEGEGEGEGIPIRREAPAPGSSRPKTEDEAVKLCRGQLIMVPDDFIRRCFNQLDAVNWIDATGEREVTKFGAYVKKAYAQHNDGKGDRRPGFHRPEPVVKRQENGKVSTGIDYGKEGGK